MKCRTMMVGLVLTSLPALAEVARIPLESLAASSNVIGLMKVDSVSTVNTVRIAIATVVKPLKSCSEGQKVAFIAQSTWTCDMSSARAGEKVMLFLRQVPETTMNLKDPRTLIPAVRRKFGSNVQLFMIAHSGRGRMTVVNRAGLDSVTVYYDVILPTNLKATYSAKDEYKQWATVQLKEFDSCLTRHMDSTKNTAKSHAR